jgi:hypothetical protein
VAVLVTDVVSLEAPALVELMWPLTTAAAMVGPAADLERGQLERLSRDADPFDAERVLRLEVDDGAACLVAVATGTPWEESLEASLWSPGYGEVRPGATWRVRLTGDGSIHVRTAFVVTRSGAAGPAREETR